MRLVSPCLIQGDNGQGKSILAKALSGATKIYGNISIGNHRGSSRLLFQDVINQTLLRSFKSLVQSQHCAPNNDVRNIYQILRDNYLSFINDEYVVIPDNFDTTTPSLLSIKMILTAVRLCSLPDALILDEPDWGLTRKSAEAFVLAVVRCAHDFRVPILIISHKPWWQEFAFSCLTVRKILQPSKSDHPYRFIISLEKKSIQ
jgi:hypothetical protein